MNMSDGQKSCLGFLFVFAAVILSVAVWIAGWAGMDFKRGTIVAVATFVFFFVIAAYLFLKVQNWGLLPIIASVVYTILPDLIIGPEDDLVVLVVGALISGVIAWRTQRQNVELLE